MTRGQIRASVMCTDSRKRCLCVQVLDILAQNTTNPVVLSGDIHNAFVWRLFRDNASTAAPVSSTRKCSPLNKSRAAMWLLLHGTNRLLLRSGKPDPCRGSKQGVVSYWHGSRSLCDTNLYGFVRICVLHAASVAGCD